MPRPIWRVHRTPPPILPMDPQPRESAVDRACFILVLVAGLVILGRVALHFISAAVS